MKQLRTLAAFCFISCFFLMFLTILWFPHGPSTIPNWWADPARVWATISGLVISWWAAAEITA